ncbi:putative damage-inducible protein DinB [Silvibacterium bohemicum]|uniref:Putative damage-inducible protein DinB n=1 Tax=Silvibacterium bohemicum TaxID=1577686 RepID=A0A841JVZ4_9BACT|nr:DinB family protein [Silvibacterium bohemicum]MBB6144627.1 putative damage-inducible protein DinB [Silvibacterium bohemicum]
MSQINPYASNLGKDDPLKVLSATPRKIEQLIEDLGSERMDQPSAPGKWSPREIVCHLADTELAFAFRLRQTLAEGDHVIQPFDQEKWAANYAAYDAREALTLFCAIRNWNLALLRFTSEEQRSKTVTHPERGAMTFWIIVETLAGHDLNHLTQLQVIARNFAPAH